MTWEGPTTTACFSCVTWFSIVSFFYFFGGGMEWELSWHSEEPWPSHIRWHLWLSLGHNNQHCPQMFLVVPPVPSAEDHCPHEASKRRFIKTPYCRSQTGLHPQATGEPSLLASHSFQPAVSVRRDQPICQESTTEGAWVIPSRPAGAPIWRTSEVWFFSHRFYFIYCENCIINSPHTGTVYSNNENPWTDRKWNDFFLK